MFAAVPQPVGAAACRAVGGGGWVTSPWPAGGFVDRPADPGAARRDQGARPMLITDAGKSVIPFRARDAKRVGEGCFYLDLIIWLSGDRIELGDRVGFNYGCYVNGYGGLAIGDRSIF